MANVAYRNLLREQLDEVLRRATAQTVLRVVRLQA